jgi:NADH-quinone oxidoreductase subunit I
MDELPSCGFVGLRIWIGLSRCMFCGLCGDACPLDALELTQDFEIANYTREGTIWDRQALEEGPRPSRYTR